MAYLPTGCAIILLIFIFFFIFESFNATFHVTVPFWVDPLTSNLPTPLVVISLSTDRAALPHTGRALEQTPIRTSGSVMRSNPLGNSSSK